MANTFLERWINVNGIRTRYITSGDGEPIIMLHGGGAGVSGQHNWERSMGPLAAAGYSVFAPEIAGFGMSDKPKSAYSVSGKIDHIQGFIDAMCFDKVCLVGNSMGGRISLWITVNRPEQVRRLILMGPGGMQFETTPALKQTFGYTPSREKMRAMMETFCYDPTIVSDEQVELRYQMSLQPGAQEAYEGFAKSRKEPADVAKLDIEPHLADIKTPTLLLWGKQDPVIPVAVGERMAALLPNVEFEIIDRCGHWIQIEHADRFNQLVIEFLNRG